MNYCILIPIYNEASRIGSIVQALIEQSVSVFVVDDASTDDGAREAQHHGATVLKLENRVGKGMAIQVALSNILQKEYHYIGFMDGDGQHAVSDISRFSESLQSEKYDLLLGDRMANPVGMPMMRYWTNRMMSKMISHLCRQKISDSQCGFRFIRSNLLKNILPLSTHGYEFESELLVACFRFQPKLQFRSIPIQTIYEDEISSIRPCVDGFKFLKFYIRALFDMTSL